MASTTSTPDVIELNAATSRDAAAGATLVPRVLVTTVTGSAGASTNLIHGLLAAPPADPPTATWAPIASSPAESDRIWVTAYNDRGQMADGRLVRRGAVACPPWLGLGSVVNVEGLGRLVCEDRYQKGMVDHLDVWRPTLAECYALTGMRRWSIVSAVDGSRR